MKKNFFVKIFVMVALLISLTSSSVLAASMSARIINRTNSDIVHVYVYGWNSNGDCSIVIRPGGDGVVKFNAYGSYVDLKAVFRNGSTSWWNDVQVSDGTQVRWVIEP